MDRKLIIIMLLTLVLRLYGINWDSGFHLHPDERMITMVANQIHFFDKLNPHFFNYGSLPLYILKGSTQLIDTLFSVNISTYQGMLYMGRLWSILFDLGTIFLLYKITLSLFKKKSIALFSSFIYAISFFPIQNTHFFTVDTMFTFLSTFLLYQLVLYIKNHSSKLVLIMGVTFAALLATKFTAVIFLPIVIFVLIIKKGFSLYSIRNTGYWILISLLFYFIFMPYAILDFSKFFADVSLQLKMNSDPYIFPYTLQYVGTTPYFYYLKNIFLWGLGPVISFLSLVGLISFSTVMLNSFQHLIRSRNKFGMTLTCHFLYFMFYVSYFIFIGMSAVKFMRYMLPLYPFFAILAGYGLYQVQKVSFLRKQESIKYYHWIPTFVGMTLAMAWTFLFISIYSKPNTRVSATEWILKNIPAGSLLAVEYWDDYLPLYDGDRYYFNELHLYDLPDNESKWKFLNDQLQKSAYIIIASNRLYTPLQRLEDCTKYKICYPKTAAYYRKLFKGELGFKKIAEFSVRPGVQVGSFKFEINDESADESFTVFDHPKVMIFKKIL